jgi:restriction system protein
MGEWIMAKRGFFSELQYQSQQAAKRQAAAHQKAVREQQAAQRRAQKEANDSERARLHRQKATAAEQKAAEKEALRLHVEDMTAQAAELNAMLHSESAEIDGILDAALSSDAFIDLEALRTKVEHPPFNPQGLDHPTPQPTLAVAPPEPQFAEPPAPKGLGGVFGKKHHVEEVAKARVDFDAAHAAWQQEAAKVPGLQLAQMQEHQRLESEREQRLAASRSAYDAECGERQREVDEANAKVDKLIADLEAHDEAAVHDYVAMVLGHSVYPDHFPVIHDFEFSPELKEVSLTVSLPGPSTLSGIKEYKYNKAKDEIVASNLTAMQVKDRYANAVYSVALRTLHEIFKTDRYGHIQTIALAVDTEDLDPATGVTKRVPLVAVGTSRESFLEIELANVVPLATLQHLKAQVSKNPAGLVAIDESRGVRGG